MQHRLEVTPADPSTLSVPRCAVVARHGLVQLETSRPLVIAKFIGENELVASSRAIEQRNPLCRVPSERVVEHRAHRRDPGAARDEQHARLLDRCRERE